MRQNCESKETGSTDEVKCQAVEHYPSARSHAQRYGSHTWTSQISDWKVEGHRVSACVGFSVSYSHFKQAAGLVYHTFTTE